MLDTIKKDDNRLQINDPGDEGRYPLIEPGPNADLFINGKKISTATVVTEEDKVRIKHPEKEIHKEIILEVSPDKLKAYIEIKIQPKVSYETVLRKFDNVVLVCGEEAERKYPEVKKQELLDLLAEENINYGLMQDELEKLTDCQESCRTLIAKGREPQAGQDGRIINIAEQKKSRQRENKEDNKPNSSAEEVSYFSREIFSVMPGDIIAVKREAVAGSAGVDVHGNKISPPPPVEKKLVAGNNVRLNQAGTRAIAIIAGRPRITEKNNKVLVEVMNQYVVDGDIDRETGRLNYKGDLYVNGSVQDFFGVSIGGSLRVKNHINNAEVCCGDDIIVKKNIIGARLLAGGSNNQLTPGKKKSYERLLSGMEEVLNGLDEVVNRSSKKDNETDNKLTAADLNERLRAKILTSEQLLKAVRDLYIDYKKKGREQKGLLDFNELNILRSYILGTKPLKAKSVTELNNIALKLQKNLSMLGLQEQSSIAAGYLQNSQVEATGDITIFQQGIYNSKLVAKNNILVYHPRSFLRGGEYEAGGWIIAGQVGVGMGTTNLKVGKGLLINQVKGVVTVVSSNDRRSFKEGQRSIYLKVNSAGKLENKSWPGWSDTVNKHLAQNLKSDWESI